MEEYTVNLYVQAVDRDAVAQAVMQALGPAYQQAGTAEHLDEEATALYVAPSIRGWVGVYDLLMESGDDGLCEWSVRQLSRSLRSVSICFLCYAGISVQYWLAQNGRLVDRYHSDPALFGPVATAEVQRLTGRPGLLSRLCGQPLNALQVAQHLREPDEDGLDRLDGLAHWLGIPNGLICFSDLGEKAAPVFVEGREQFRAITLRELLAPERQRSHF